MFNPIVCCAVLRAHAARRCGPAFARPSSLLLAAVFLLLFAPLSALGAESPAQALARAQQGIDKADADLFNSAVDVNSIVSKASSPLLAAFRDQAAEGKLGDSNMVMILALAGAAEESGKLDLVKPLLISEVRGFVATGINGGYFSGRPDATVKPPRGSLASSLTKMPKGRREIVPGKILSEQGDKAVMSATFVDPKAGRLPLELALEKRNNTWQVVEITNARELFNEAVRRNR